jgi:hypothetical protein
MMVQAKGGLPLPTPVATPTQAAIGPRVIHVHSNNATTWTGSDPLYHNYVNQDVVDEMVDQGMMALTGASTVAGAWRSVLPAYQVGQRIAIKVNFNSTLSCAGTDTEWKIDAVIEPVNAVVRGLKSIGVAEADIWVYDAIRWIPDRFISGCRYPGVKFLDRECRNLATFSSNDPNAVVAFSPPVGVPVPSTVRIADLLIGCTCLINMPLCKIHTSAGVTLGFKNHLGTINLPSALHDHIGVDSQYFRSDYNPLVDLYKSPHILGKTVLTVGDGLFALGFDSPALWSTYGNQPPNSLFFSLDPVAIDSVMADFLDAEAGIDPRSRYYLPLAEASGLGIFEQGDPWASGYTRIDYRRVEV